MKSNSFNCNALIVGRDEAACAAPISLTLDAGSLLAVYGANGSGKSTLLKTLAGLLPAISGSYRFESESDTLLYVGHRHGMLGELSVRDNVAFWAQCHGVTELTATALHYFDLEPFAHLPLGELSAGWQQRVALTRLITMPAAFWLLDEPAANLDREGTSLLHSLLQTRIEQRGIVLLTSHSPWSGERIHSITLERHPEAEEIF